MRVFAAAAAVAASALALGLPWAPQFGGTSDGGPAAVSADSAVSEAPLPSAGHEPSGTVEQPAPPAQASGFLTDARALVPFNRTTVRTVAKGGHPRLNVASADLKRPPKGSLMAPLEVLTPSSPFGYRVSPLTGARGDFHLGQDYAARCGTRVYAADSGVVRAAGWHPWGGGNRVEIDHGNGLITTYNHLDAIAVRTGDSVQVGQVMARVGTTGWSTGCHLHFETILGGKHTSPLNWTLIPIRQLDDLADIAMVSFEASPSSEALRWAIPVAEDQTHRVLFGDDELRDPPGPEPAAAASETATPTASAAPTGTSTASETTTPTGTSSSGTATPTPSPTGTAPSGTATPSPRGTSSSGTAAPAPAPAHAPSPTPTPSPTGTPTPTPQPETSTATPTPTPAATTPTSGRRDRRTQEPTPTPTTDPTTATGSAIADPGSGETSALPTAGS